MENTICKEKYIVLISILNANFWCTLISRVDSIKQSDGNNNEEINKQVGFSN